MTGVSLPSIHSDKFVAHETIFSFRSTRTENELIAKLEKIVSLLHFDIYLYHGQFPAHCGNVRQRTFSNLPTDTSSTYVGTSGTQFKPFIHHVERRLTPVRLRDVTAETLALANGSAVEDGVMVPVHGRSGETGTLGFFVTRGHNKIEQTINSSLSDIGLAAMYFHEAMIRIIAGSLQAPKSPLTAREIECLHWIASHKSNWAISKILGISEHGVVYYVRRLMWKLDAENRYQAVERATAYDLI
jgi:LuxR family quorum-sensing transcriptional regulator LasR